MRLHRVYGHLSPAAGLLPSYRQDPPPNLTRSALTSSFGLLIDGLHAADAVSNVDLGAWLVAALHRYGVLVITGQHALVESPADFSAFASLFGRPHEWDFYKQKGPLLPDRPEILPVTNLGGTNVLSYDQHDQCLRVDWSVSQPSAYKNDNCSFHTDHAFHEEPASATLLLPVFLPGEQPGLETDFISLSAARQQLPSVLADELTGKQGIHGWGPGLLDGWMAENAGDKPPPPTPYDSQMQNEETSSNEAKNGVGNHDVGKRKRAQATRKFLAQRHVHMLDRPHPVTGEPVIYAPFGTCMGITGLAEDEAFKLLRRVAAHCIQPQYRYCLLSPTASTCAPY